MTPVDPRLLRHARAARRFLVVTVVVGAVAGALVIAQANLLATAISAAFLGGADLDALSWTVGGLVAIIAARAALGWMTEVAAHRTAASVRTELRRKLLARVAEDGPVALAGRSRAELAVTATRGVEALDGWFARYLPQVALALIVPAIAIAWIWPRDRLTVGLLAVTLPLIPVFMALIGRMAEQRTKDRWRTLQRLGGHFLDVLAGLPTLKANGRAGFQRRQVREVTEQFRRTTMGTLRIAFLSSGWLELMATIGTAMIAVGVGLRLVEGTLDLQTGLAILILAPEIYLPVRQVGQQFHASTEGMEAAGELLAIIDAPTHSAGDAVADGSEGAGDEAAGVTGGPAGTGPPDPPAGGPALPVAGEATVRLDHVWLSYPDRGPALAGLDLTIHPHQRLALVGPTGAGKSSVLALLLGFARADAGEVTALGPGAATGVRLDRAGEPRLRHWRAGVAWVPQRPHLFTGSIGDNVRLGRPAASDRQVTDALEAVGLGHLAARADEDVGERGARLSRLGFGG